MFLKDFERKQVNKLQTLKQGRKVTKVNSKIKLTELIKRLT